MTEQLILKETAVLAKEKGFDEETYDYFNQNGECETSLEKEYFNKGIHTFENIITISCPTQSLLQKWLREKHNIDILILGTSGFYYIGIHKKDFHNLPKYFYPNFKSYENTLEFGLQEALKLI